MSIAEFEIVFSRVKPAGWPPLHAQVVGENRTLCGIPTDFEWDYDGDCKVPEDVECKRCLRILAAEEPVLASQDSRDSAGLEG